VQNSKFKIASTLAAIIFFIIPLFIFIFSFSQAGIGDVGALDYIAPYALMFLCLGELLAWYGLGRAGGVTFFIASVPVVILASLSLRSFIYNFQILILAGIAVPSFLFYKQKNAILIETQEEAEDIQEEQNMLNARIKKGAELTKALTKKLDRYNKLKDLGESFNAKFSLGDIYQLTIERSCDIIGKTDEAKLFLVNDDANDLDFCARKISAKVQSRAKFSKSADIFDKWVFEKIQPLQVSDVTKDFRFDYRESGEKNQFNSLIIVPLIIDRRIAGILRLASMEAQAYAADDLRLLDFISDLSSAAIHNARLYIKTQELAIRDSLTGLYVHRYFKERLKEELTRCREAKDALSIVMLDIDHFKDYNDKYGHAAGDKVLKGITEIMRHNTKDANILTRYGGEEFVALFPGKDKEQTKAIAEHIRDKIQSASFMLRRQDTKVTASFGVAAFSVDASGDEELLKKVDFFLYQAKRQGRNKVCSS